MLVLASSSPRRQELLRTAGIPFTTYPTHIPELPRPGENPRDCAERLAREKARAALGRQPDSSVLGADTIVVVDGEMLGKPRDAADAARMLRLLSGRTHQVITGVCLLGPLIAENQSAENQSAENQSAENQSAENQSAENQRTENQKLETRFEDTRSETTLVTMTTLTDDDIRSYIASGEPMDKAGAYGIQGIASRWVPRIEGDYFNVVGLPVAMVYGMLREHGIDGWQIDG